MSLLLFALAVCVAWPRSRVGSAILSLALILCAGGVLAFVVVCARQGMIMPGPFGP